MKRIFTIAMILVAGGSAFAQNLQGDLENWRTYSAGNPPTSLETPEGWYSADSLIYSYAILAGSTPQQQLIKSASSHGGQYAASITTRDLQGLIGVVTGLMTNAEIDFDFNIFSATGDALAALSYSGGTSVSQRVGGITAWVNYTPANDTGRMMIQALKNTGGNPDSVVGTGSVYITQTSGWAPIYGNINYVNSTVVPDRLVVAFFSSVGTTPVDGSTLLVDDVDIVSVGLNDPALKDAKVLIYPNPAKEFISLEAKESGNFTWEAYNMQGQRVAARIFKGKASADISSLPNGIYIYSIYDEAGAPVQRGKFNVVK